MQLELQPFLRDVEGFLLPLTDAQQGPGKSMDQAFNAAKTTLATATEVEHPQADFPISLIVHTALLGPFLVERGSRYVGWWGPI